jgi:hypothetical protein
VGPARKAAAATDPAKAMGVDGGAGPAGQGPAPDLARGVNCAGDRRRSKGEALLGVSASNYEVASAMTRGYTGKDRAQGNSTARERDAGERAGRGA